MRNPTLVQAPVATATMETDNGVTWLLEYYLQTYESSDGVELYGVKVDKLGGDGTLKESSETFAITDEHGKAQEILTFLAKGSVPPCVLVEMVDEWFSNNIWASGSNSSAH